MLDVPDKNTTNIAVADFLRDKNQILQKNLVFRQNLVKISKFSSTASVTSLCLVLRNVLNTKKSFYIIGLGILNSRELGVRCRDGSVSDFGKKLASVSVSVFGIGSISDP
jgi:hypothetical protein